MDADAQADAASRIQGLGRMCAARGRLRRVTRRCYDKRFDRAAHTERARQVLRRLAVPGLAEVPIPPPLVRPPPSLLVRLAAWVLAVLKHVCALPHHMWAIIVARAAVARLGGLSPAEPRQTRGVAGGKSSVIEQM